MKLRETRGVTLIETLVVIAIIMILMAMYLPVLSRALQKARGVAATEAVRQERLGRFADNANRARPSDPPAGRAESRDAYRTLLETSGEAQAVTLLKYVVRNDDEFLAYFYTLIDPGNTAPLQYDAGLLVARDPSGRQFLLPPIDDLDAAASRYGRFAAGWTFISANLAGMTEANIGAYVIFSDAHVDYMRYPGEFPMTRLVAELSQAYAEYYVQQ